MHFALFHKIRYSDIHSNIVFCSYLSRNTDAMYLKENKNEKVCLMGLNLQEENHVIT